MEVTKLMETTLQTKQMEQIHQIKQMEVIHLRTLIRTTIVEHKQGHWQQWRKSPQVLGKCFRLVRSASYPQSYNV